MAIIHDTTMSPGKLELLQAWLPAQPWYRGTGQEPRLTKAGGFRLDDPAGAVGIEFMVVIDGSASPAIAYQVPMTYRAAALPEAGDGLIGTAEHGVLGPRWIYDGPRDPVLVAQLVALLAGTAEPQAQNVSDTPDPTVTTHPVANGAPAPVGPIVTASGPGATEVQVPTAGPDSGSNGQLVLRINRILHPSARAGRPHVAASWRLANGTRARGVFATAAYLPEPAAH